MLYTWMIDLKFNSICLTLKIKLQHKIFNLASIWFEFKLMCSIEIELYDSNSILSFQFYQCIYTSTVHTSYKCSECVKIYWFGVQQWTVNSAIFWRFVRCNCINTKLSLLFLWLSCWMKFCFLSTWIAADEYDEGEWRNVSVRFNELACLIVITDKYRG